MPVRITHKSKKLVFTVTNDLNYDQRMIRICSSMQTAGYRVLLVGRKRKSSLLLHEQPFSQKRLPCFFDKGKLFYLEYNIRLFFFLLFSKMDAICAIDLDTIMPCYLVSRLRKKPRVYDAHELFCEMKEITTRPSVRKVWEFIERKTVPRFQYGYTVNKPIRDIFKTKYNVDYEVVMNVPIRQNLNQLQERQIHSSFIIYQGAINHGRSFETLIPAFQYIDCPIWIYGDGNFLDEAKQLAIKYKVENKVLFKGKLLPSRLKEITPQAVMGITLFEKEGLNNYYSLANRFFDYIQAGIPQVCVKYPAYEEINDDYEVAVLIEDLNPLAIAEAINSILKNSDIQHRLHENALKAREVYCWQQEEKKLIAIYNKIFGRA